MENFKREALKGERPLRLQWIDYWVSVITKMHEDERSSISNGLEEQIKIYRDKMAFASTQLDMVVAGNEDLVAEVGRPAIPDVKSLVQDIIANLQKYLTPGSPELGTNGSEVNASANTLAPIEPIRISPDAPDADMSGDDDNRSVTVLPQPQERSGLTAEALQGNCPRSRPDSASSGTTRLERHDHVSYDLPSDSEGSTQRLAGIRTIHSEEVDGSDYIFEYSAAGPGWFVIRCDGEHAKSGYMHQFDANPFAWGRAKKHFKYRAARDKCHDIDVIGAYSELEMLRKFGYRVVDSEGHDVSKEWVTASNEYLAATKEKAKAKGKPKAKTGEKGKGKKPASPGSQSRAYPEVRPATRPNTDGFAATYVPDQSAPAAGRIPTADMGGGEAELEGAQQNDAGVNGNNTFE